MIRAISWPHQLGPLVLEGWLFGGQLDSSEVMTLCQAVEEPPGIERGTARWNEWMLGRNAAISAAKKVGIQQPVIEVSSMGAPCIQGSEMGLSIAHTRGVVLAAVAPGHIGIDVERSDRDVSRLARGLRPGEAAVATSISVLGCLVAKEAVAKATGLGLGGSLARWPLVDAELSGSSPKVSVAAPDGRIVTSQLFHWRDFVVGIAHLPPAHR